MSRTKDRKRARLDAKRAREAQAWQAKRDAKRAHLRLVTGECLRDNGYTHVDHDMTTGFAPRGTHAQDRPSKRHRQLIRAWDDDEIVWRNGRTMIHSRVRESVDTGESYSISHAGRTAPAGRRVDNTPGRSTGWHDDNEKAERAFARELRISRREA